MHLILGRASFCMNYYINAEWHGGNHPVALLSCNGSPGCFDSGLQVRFSMGFRSGEFAGQSSTVTPGSLNQLWYLWQCGQVPSPAGKWNQHLHKACQQKEAWGALRFRCRWLLWLWTSENTVDQQQQMTCQPKSSLTVETSHWTSSNLDSVPLQSSSRLWDLDFQMKCKIDFHLKRGLCTTAQLRCFWRCFWFRSGLVDLFTSDIWAWWLLMHWLQLQFTLCEALPSVWIGFAWQYSQACCHLCCLCTFSYPIFSFQSTLHLICFDTALLEQPPLSVMCDLPSLWRVSMIFFWTIAKSAVFPIIMVLNNMIYPEFILYGWSFIEAQI